MIITSNTIAKPHLHLEENHYIIDIETTGFSPKYASIYMIGIAYLKKNHIMIEQWFCEKESDEYELLFRFNQLLCEDVTLYHYNGDRFDMPFIKQRMSLFSMSMNSYESVDLLTKVRPFKQLLGLENLKLKTIEAYFGYERDDPFTGGDLIEHYKNYLQHPQEETKAMLLLHNYEDLIGLMDVLSHLPVIQLFENFKEKSMTHQLIESYINETTYVATIKTLVSGQYCFKHPLATININDHKLSINIQAVVGTLYYFFPDYQNYYYLPEEDYAIHKSIGAFVDKTHRIKAKKNNAYVKKDSIFLPALKKYELNVPLYYDDPTKKRPYASIEDLVQHNQLATYIQEVLARL